MLYFRVMYTTYICQCGSAPFRFKLSVCMAYLDCHRHEVILTQSNWFINDCSGLEEATVKCCSH